VERKDEAALRETIARLKNRDFKYESRDEKQIDWQAYNQA